MIPWPDHGGRMPVWNLHEPPFMSVWKRVASCVLGLAAPLAGCEGTIGDPMGNRTDRPGGDYCASVDLDPGRVTVHRLNRDEYDNTVRDLLFEPTHPGAALPVDDESGDGFLNDADVLSIGTLLVEKYDGVARELAPDAVARTEFRDAYLDCTDGRACVESFVRDFGLRAFRRPPTDTEVRQLADLIENGSTDGDLDAGLELGIRAMLLSPSFLFRAEPHTTDVRELDSYEVASRLSYFLWQTMPDQELFDLAAEGALTEESTVRDQVDRMIEDPRFDGFFEGFLNRWLRVYRLEDYTPAETYAFDEELRTALFAETEAFVRHIIETDAPLTELLTANYSFLNERLADHYGVEGVSGDELQRVTFDEQRGGLLTQGSILAVTSHPNRTSPVQRGKWILEQLLCAPPPDPPADVDALLPENESGEPLTVRERLAEHRRNPECAVCHDKMDPLGLAFENFDPVGMWRDEESGHEVIATGELPDGTLFDGALELAQILAADEAYVGCVTEKLMAYSLGRALETTDYCIVDRVVDRASARGGSFRAVMEELVVDDVFRSVGGREEVER